MWEGFLPKAELVHGLVRIDVYMLISFFELCSPIPIPMLCIV